jgi:hypothetical protein
MDRLIGTTVKRNKNLEKKEEGKKKAKQILDGPIEYRRSI